MVSRWAAPPPDLEPILVTVSQSSDMMAVLLRIVGEVAEGTLDVRLEMLISFEVN